MDAHAIASHQLDAHPSLDLQLGVGRERSRTASHRSERAKVVLVHDRGFEKSKSYRWNEIESGNLELGNEFQVAFKVVSSHDDGCRSGMHWHKDMKEDAYREVSYAEPGRNAHLQYGKAVVDR